MSAVFRVGLLVGRERTFPDALIRAVNDRHEGVAAEYATVDVTRADLTVTSGASN